MKTKKQLFGILSDGTEISLYTISNKHMSFSATDYGCNITSIMVPDKNGKLADIALGFSTFDGYVTQNNVHFGSFVGRYANRIGNASFTLNNKEYKLDKNDGENCLHGGFNSYARMVWSAKFVKTYRGQGISFTRTSPDGEQGFPGNLDLTVNYLLTEDNELVMEYSAECDKDTPISLTNHSYFNLKGQGNGTVLDHELMLNADSILEVDDNLIPTGKLADVTNTPFDFRKTKTIGKDIKDTKFGYDHCYVLNKSKEALSLCAEVKDPESNRSMTIYTNQPGVQLYTGNFLNNKPGKNLVQYPNQGAFCLETQAFPDAPNKKDFPSTILKAGEVFSSVTSHTFKW